MRNLQRRFDRYYIGQIYDGDFVKFCGLLRIYELYTFRCWLKSSATDNTLEMFKICLNRGHGIKTFVPRTTHNHKSQKKNWQKNFWFCKTLLTALVDASNARLELELDECNIGLRIFSLTLCHFLDFVLVMYISFTFSPFFFIFLHFNLFSWFLNLLNIF